MCEDSKGSKDCEGSAEFRYGPAFVGAADCCGKPKGCTNLSPTCLFANSPLKHPELAASDEEVVPGE